jgi:hypothetical protein
MTQGGSSNLLGNCTADKAGPALDSRPVCAHNGKPLGEPPIAGLPARMTNERSKANAADLLICGVLLIAQGSQGPESFRL